MPKATKPHYQKKDPAAHEAWITRKREDNKENQLHQLFQREYRKGVLKDKIAAGELTLKNRKEAIDLGVLKICMCGSELGRPDHVCK